MTGLHHCNQICRGTRCGSSLWKAKIEVGGEVVTGGVAPLALLKAISGRQQFQCINTQVEQMSATCCECSGSGKAEGGDTAFYQCQYISEGSTGELYALLTVHLCPARREFILHKRVIRGQSDQARIIVPINRLSCRITGHKATVLKHYDASRVAIHLCKVG